MSSLSVSATVEDILQALELRGNPQVRRLNARNGAPENQYGVKLGDLRTIAKSLKTNHELGLQLWDTGNADAMLLAILIMKPKLLSPEDLERMTAAAAYVQLADWLTSYVTKQHPAKESLRRRWMHSDDPWLARAGWSLTAERIVKDPDGLDLSALLDRVEREMGTAHPAPQWTMNYCLAETGIHFPGLRQRALDIGERLGIYRDYPCPKGCTSPFAPIWIHAMVARQG